jgi:hypothetical protein
MESICDISHYLAPLLVHCGPSRVLVIITSNKVILFLEGIKKIHPSRSWPKNYRLILDMFLTVSLPPISNMGKGLKEWKVDLFTAGKIVDREITL